MELLATIVLSVALWWPGSGIAQSDLHHLHRNAVWAYRAARRTPAPFGKSKLSTASESSGTKRICYKQLEGMNL